MPILGEPGGCPCCTAELNKELKPRGSVQALHTLFLSSSSSNVPSLIYTVKPRFTAGFGGRQKPAVNRGFGFWGPKLAKKGGKGL